MNVSKPSKDHTLFHYLLFAISFLLIVVFLIQISVRILPPKKLDKPSQSTSNSLPTVILDAGHGGEDGGAIGTNGSYEKDLNLSIAKLIDEMLRASGIETVMTRTEDVLLYDKNSDYHGHKKVQDLANRKKIAEEYENALFISIHMNSFPQSQYSGLQVYYSLNDPRSLALAQGIQETTKSVLMPSNQRKIKPSNGNLYLLDHIESPAVLIECGFLSNPEECLRLSDESYQKQLSLAITLSILDYFSKSTQNPTLGS